MIHFEFKKRYTYMHISPTFVYAQKNTRKNTDQALYSGNISGEWRGKFYFTYNRIKHFLMRSTQVEKNGNPLIFKGAK